MDGPSFGQHAVGSLQPTYIKYVSCSPTVDGMTHQAGLSYMACGI